GYLRHSLPIIRLITAPLSARRRFTAASSHRSCPHSRQISRLLPLLYVEHLQQLHPSASDSEPSHGVQRPFIPTAAPPPASRSAVRHRPALSQMYRPCRVRRRARARPRRPRHRTLGADAPVLSPMRSSPAGRCSLDRLWHDSVPCPGSRTASAVG